MRKVNVFFRKDKDYKIMPVSGIRGGLTPQGMVCVDFFVEKSEIPEKSVVEVDELSGNANELPITNEQYYVREVLACLLFQPETARGIGQFLIQQADQFDKLMLDKRKK